MLINKHSEPVPLAAMHCFTHDLLLWVIWVILVQIKLSLISVKSQKVASWMVSGFSVLECS